MREQKAERGLDGQSSAATSSYHASVLIVGGGFAGVSAAMAAAELRTRAGLGMDDVSIVLVNIDEWLTLRPRLYESDLSSARVSLREVLEPVGVELVVAEVTQIDVDERTVVLGPSRVGFDRLVLAAGSRVRRPPIDALHDVDTFDAASAVQANVRSVAWSDRPLDERFGVVVVGAGLAGIETATELAGTLSDLAEEAGHPGASRVVLVDPASSVGALLGEAPAEVVADALRTTGVELVLGHRVTAADARGATLDNGDRIPGGTVVWTAGLEASPLVVQVAGRHQLDRSGRIRVDEFLRIPDQVGVLAAGDVAAAPVDDEHTTVMSCQHAIPSGRTAGHNAIASLIGQELQRFEADPYVTCIDLGAAGGLLTTGWDRIPVATGAEGKRIKREIVEMIHPARWRDARSGGRLAG